jgi:serine/threonine protein phosphatase PrpC
MTTPISENSPVFWSFEKSQTPGVADRLVLKVQDIVLSQIDCLLDESASREGAGSISITYKDGSGEEKTKDVFVKGLTTTELTNKMMLEQAIAQNIAIEQSPVDIRNFFSFQLQKITEQIEQIPSKEIVQKLSPIEDNRGVFDVFVRKSPRGALTVQSRRDYFLSKLEEDPYFRLPQDLWKDSKFLKEAFKKVPSCLRGIDLSKMMRILHAVPDLLQDISIAHQILHRFSEAIEVKRFVLQTTDNIDLIKSIVEQDLDLLQQPIFLHKLSSLQGQDAALDSLLEIKARGSDTAIEKMLELSPQDREYVILAIIKKNPAFLDKCNALYEKKNGHSIVWGREFISKVVLKNLQAAQPFLEQISHWISDEDITPQEKTIFSRYLLHLIRKDFKAMLHVPSVLRLNYFFMKKAFDISYRSFFLLTDQEKLSLIKIAPEVVSWPFQGDGLAAHLGPSFITQAIEENPDVVSHMPLKLLSGFVVKKEVEALCQEELTKREIFNRQAELITKVEPKELSVEEKIELDKTLQKAYERHTHPTSLCRDCYIFPLGRQSDPRPSHFIVQIEQQKHTKASKSNKDLEDVCFYKEYEGGILLGVFDGHGGKGVAEYISQRLQTLFAFELNKHQGHVPSTLRDLFAFLHKEVNGDVDCLKVGSTAVLSFLDTQNATLYTATLGDSEAFVYSKSANKLVALSVQGSWSNPEEQRRAREMGGEIIISPYVDKNNIPILRVNNSIISLEVSEGFGDASFGPIVGRVPHITATKISKGETVILVSDGIIALQETEILQIMESCPEEELSRQLCAKARAVSKDDLTVVALHAK